MILIVDGHASHEGIETLQNKTNKIIIILYSSHAASRSLIFCTLKNFYQEIFKWLKAHFGRVVTQFQIDGLFNEAYDNAATVQNGSMTIQKHWYLASKSRNISRLYV